MRGGSGDTRVTKTAENSKTIVGQMRAKEKVVRSIVPLGTAWAKVNEEGSSGEGIRPKAGWHVSVKKKGTNTFIDGAKYALNPSIFLRSVWT